LVLGGSVRCIPCPDWEWADIDGERLVWAAGGKLFASTLDQDGMTQEAELQDFSEMTFEPIEAPY